MLIYNVTTKVDHSIAAEWLLWMREEHIPELIATECFIEAVILKLLEIDDSEGPTYAVQYKIANNTFYNTYIEKFSEGLRKKVLDKWGNKIIAFRTLMQVVQ